MVFEILIKSSQENFCKKIENNVGLDAQKFWNQKESVGYHQALLYVNKNAVRMFIEKIYFVRTCIIFDIISAIWLIEFSDEFCVPGQITQKSNMTPYISKLIKILSFLSFNWKNRIWLHFTQNLESYI